MGQSLGVMPSQILSSLHFEARSLKVCDNPTHGTGRIGTWENMLIHEEAPHVFLKRIVVTIATAEACDLDVERAVVCQDTVHLAQERIVVANSHMFCHLNGRNDIEALWGNVPGHEVVEHDVDLVAMGSIQLPSKRRLVLNLLPMAFTHNTDTDNQADVPVAYNKGDDWFGATLGDPMVYTSAIYLGKDDDIWQGQVQKLNYILDSAMVKPGMKVLDIGCGWGRL